MPARLGPTRRRSWRRRRPLPTRSRARARACGMIRLLREFRLIPVVLIATGCLFALKIVGLMLDGGYRCATAHSRNKNRHRAPTAECWNRRP